MPQTRVRQHFLEMLQTLSPHFEGRLVMGGDSNIAFDQLLDKTSTGAPQRKRPPKQSLCIAQLLHTLGLVDIWREMNPSSRNYTHYSAPHKTYGRIDHIFLPTLDIRTASQAIILDVAWSDHSLILLILSKAPSPSGPHPWRLNKSLLSDTIRCTMLEKEMKEFFLLNDVEDISPGALWGAHKAVIHGKLVQLTSQLKRECQVHVDKLDEEFKPLSKTHKHNPTIATLVKLDTAKLALNLALTSSAEKV